jgi:D-hydroxyproline dehydrogenase subunit alpha
VDHSGRPVAGSEKTIDVDCICLGYGLLPDTQLTRLLECRHAMHPYLRAWVPVRDEWLQTSLPGVFAIGDAAEISGKMAAMLEGKIAALAVACQLGHLSKENIRGFAQPIQSQLAVERRFAQLLYRAFSLPDDPCPLAEPDTVICRCECVTYRQIQEAIRDGATSVQAVKYLCRTGMGWCRGTHCAPIISRMVSQLGGIGLEEASQTCIRPPLFPITLEEALDLEGLS